MNDLLERELSSKVVSGFFEVHRGMGPGLLETVYESALAVELTDRDLRVERQKQFKAFYKGSLVNFRGDKLDYTRLVL